MAKTTSNGNQKNIDFSNLIINYAEGDVVVFDEVRHFSHIMPLKPITNVVAMCVSGSMKAAINEKPIEIVADDILFCPPNSRIAQCEYSDDFECKVLTIADHVVQGLLHDKLDVWHRVIYMNRANVVTMSDMCKEEIEFYYSLIRSKVYNEREEPQEILQSLLRALLLELCHVLESTQMDGKDMKLSQGKVLFNKFLNLISSSHVKRRPINYYAGKLAITPKYLTMLCQKYSDKTASEWVIQYTIEDIRFYLRNSNLSIKEISAKLGFSNMSHFGSYVRKHMGVSPSEYRRM